MPDDTDRALARLVVDAGLLTRDEAAHFWQQIQAPGSPRFVAALLQSGRLAPAQVDQLRALWQQQGGARPTGALPRPTAASGSGSGANLAASTPLQASSGALARPGPMVPPTLGPMPGPYTTAPVGPPPAAADPLGGEATWEEAVARDAQLARVLYTRGLVTQDRLRECRELQLKHKARLGVVLVKKGYVERAAVDEALAVVRAPGGAPPPGPAAPGGGPILPPPATNRLAAPPPGHELAPNPFAPPPGVVDQDAMPTLNVGPGGIPGFPGAGIPPGMSPGVPSPQDGIPTIVGAPSIEELNPFASVSAPGRGVAPPPGLQPMLSGDELNAFENVPLSPVGSVRGAQSPLLQSTRGGSGGSNPAAGWGPGPSGPGSPEAAPAGFGEPPPFGADPGGAFAPAFTPAGPAGAGGDTTRGPAAGAEHAPAPRELGASGGSKTKVKKKPEAGGGGMGTGKLLALILAAGLGLLGVVLVLLWLVLK